VSQKDQEESQIEEKLQQAKNQRTQIELAIRKIDEEYTTNTKRKKELEEEQTSKRNLIEDSLTTEAETAFNAYMIDQAGTFEVITRTYGTKVSLLKSNFY